MTLAWRVDGVETDLDDRSADFFVVRGPVGLDAPPVANSLADFTYLDGAVLTRRRRTVRQVVLPFFVSHASRIESAVAELVSLLQGPGELIYDDGSIVRSLRSVVYESGLGGDLSQFPRTSPRRVVASLLALDPWWYGPTQIRALSLSEAPAFDAPIPFDAAVPFDGDSSVAIAVEGDADALPVIVVYGPASSVVMKCGSTSWETAVALGGADVLVVDTRPGSRGPRLNGAGVDWSLLTAESRLWQLPVGLSSVVFRVVGESDLTAAQIEFEPRYLTP